MLWLIILIIIMISSSLCISFALGITGLVTNDKYKKDSLEWKCTDRDPGNPNEELIIGKLNSEGDSECIALKGAPGCFALHLSEEEEKKKTKKNYKPEDTKKYMDLQCSQAISEFPNIKIDGKTLQMESYTCGEKGKHKQLFNITGYDDPGDDCAIIKNDRSYSNYLRRLVS